MNQDEFVYYFDPEDLEPFADGKWDEYSEQDSFAPKDFDEALDFDHVRRSPSNLDVQLNSTTTESPATESIVPSVPNAEHISSMPSESTLNTKDQTRNDSDRIRSLSTTSNSPAVSSDSGNPDLPSNLITEPILILANGNHQSSRSLEKRPDHSINFDTTVKVSEAMESGRSSKSKRTSPFSQRTIVSVHTLGQFVFCSRSGIYSAENPEETEFDEPTLRLDYLPNFDLERIEELLSESIRKLGISIVLVASLSLATIGCIAAQNRMLLSVSLVATLISLTWPINLLVVIFALMWRRLVAQRSAKSEPSPEIECIKNVNWWSMLKSGFEPVNYQRQFRHPHLPLEGSPWRVLERGSLRIPVIRSGSDKLGDRKHSIYPKHEIRLAAYALLLEAIDHVKVPYGLVFPADSHIGLATPISDTLRQVVADRLDDFLELLHQSQNGVSEPRLPKDRKRCLNCELGNPVPISNSEIKKAKREGTPLVILQDCKFRKFHCRCADRFGSVPLHRRKIELGLNETLE